MPCSFSQDRCRWGCGPARRPSSAQEHHEHDSHRTTHCSHCSALCAQVLIAPPGHPALGGGLLEREQLYSLTFVCLNEGSTVQAAQAAMLRRHGISWRRLKIDMVGRKSGSANLSSCLCAHTERSVRN